MQSLNTLLSLAQVEVVVVGLLAAVVEQVDTVPQLVFLFQKHPIQ
jgi:hypothetical protein